MSTSIVGASTKREGQCSIRSSGGIAQLDETYSYIVEATAKDEPYVSVLQTANIPRPGLTLSPSGLGICRTVSASRWETNPYYWNVTAEFSSEVEENQNSQNPTEDPLVWLPIYETKFERLQEVVTKDRDGDSIANSAGQPFETGLTVSRFIPIWEFFQFEPATLSDEQIIERNECTNEDVFKLRPAGTLLLTVVSSVVGFYYGRKIRFTKYQLRYNRKNWTHKRLDVGTVYKSGSDLLPYTDKFNNVILGALNGSGAKQAVGTAPAELEFNQYEELRFADFLRI
jgi:hypothetical protein